MGKQPQKPQQPPTPLTPTPGGGQRSMVLPLVIGVVALLLIVPFFLLGGSNNPSVLIETTMGNIKVELFQSQAPITVKNFLNYVDDKFYDGTIFHRVMSDFMIQGGGFTPDMKEKPTQDNIKNESTNGLSNQRGTIAMARTGDPHSASAQWFINVVDNSKGLDRANSRDKWGYAVFGKVTEGMNVVDSIRKVPVDDIKGHENVPVQPVIIKSIRRVSE